MTPFVPSITSSFSLRMFVSLLMTVGLLCCAHAVLAEESPKRAKRNVSFELDVVEGAVSYEVEITQPSGKLVGRFPLKSPVFSGKLGPGAYRLRSRSSDSRGLAGEWSEFETFEVHALAPTLLQPKDQSVAEPEVDGRVHFKWEAGSGAARYRIDITSPSRSLSEFVDTTEFSAWLPAGAYEVKVSSLLADGGGGEKSQVRGTFKIEKELPKNLIGQMDFVWKPVTGAKDYEFEVTGDSLTDSHKLTATEWHAPYKAGKYNLRTRARKANGAYSEWTPTDAIEVLSQSPNVTAPAPDARIETTDKLETSIGFRWSRSFAAAKYQLEIREADTEGKSIGAPVFNDTVSDTEVSAKLSVGKAYVWTLVPLDPQGSRREASAVGSRVYVLGTSLDAPQITEPDTQFVSELQWRANDPAKSFDYSLQRWDDRKKTWNKVMQKRNTPETKIAFPANYPGGKYRLAVRSVGTYSKPSKFSSLEFPVFAGDRSPQASAAYRRREFLAPIRGLYLHASYLVANVAYSGEDAETNSSITLNALGGTGRLGLGYNPPQSAFGLFGVVDLSGIRISGQNYTFASSEAHVQYRKDSGNLQHRFSTGLFYKELVGIQGRLGQLDFTSVNSIATAGPHVGYDLTYALNKEYGLQLNTRLYISAVGIKTPNGAPVATTLSYQLGFLGSKKLSAHAVGYLGYVFRTDNAAYKSTANDDSSHTITSLAGPDSLQQIGLTGHYLNLIYEFGW